MRELSGKTVDQATLAGGAPVSYAREVCPKGGASLLESLGHPHWNWGSRDLRWPCALREQLPSAPNAPASLEPAPVTILGILPQFNPILAEQATAKVD